MHLRTGHMDVRQVFRSCCVPIAQVNRGALSLCTETGTFHVHLSMLVPPINGYM